MKKKKSIPDNLNVLNVSLRADDKFRKILGEQN